jgi:hypothetical protein
VTQPKFTLHARRPRRPIRWDGSGAAFLYMVVSYGLVLVALYFAVRAFPGVLDVLKHGRPS